MNGILVDEFGGLGAVISIGFIILVLFVVLRFFKMIFSPAFIGFLLSLVSYFVYDYFLFGLLRVVACIALLLCVTGFSDRGLIGRIFALIGTMLSLYLIITGLGFAI
ncbi:MAG: hypothetical protein IJ565_02305 [Bacilli bacterium]|nr:hypothetical protein [Bacilli bacterium]